MRKFFAVFFLFSNVLYASYLRVYYVLYGNSTLGDCIFIELPNGKNVLIDGGRLSSTLNPDLYLEDFLDAKNITTINHMILTHPDADHSSGLKMVMDNYVVENFYCTGEAEIDEMNEEDPNRILSEACAVWKISKFTSDFGLPAHNCYLSGPNTNFGPNWDNNVDVRVLCADDSKSAVEEANERSLVIKLSFGESSFYFGGDAEGAQEDYIMTNVPSEAPIDIFKVEHHGSNTPDTNESNKEAFIEWMKPKFAIIPTGGHTVPNGPPADETIKRLINNKVVIYRTDLDGTVLVKADDKGNYDIVRMNAFEKLENTDGDDYQEVIPSPEVFPGYSGAGFDLGSAVSLTYVLPPPDLPQNLVIKKNAGDEITIEWDFDETLAGYYLYYSTQSGGDPGANNSWINAGMTEETGIYKRYDTMITSHPFTFSAKALGLVQPSYLRLSAVTTYFYERRYSNEVYTTWPPTAITNLTGFYISATGGDVNLSWTAPTKYNNGSSTEPVSQYYVYYSTNSSVDVDFWNEVNSVEKYGIDFSTITPKNPGETESFLIKRVDSPNQNALTYFAVVSKNADGVLSAVSNITTFTVSDVLAPSSVTDLSYAGFRDEGSIYVSWTAPGDDGEILDADFCKVIFSEDETFSSASTRTVSSDSVGKTQKYLITGLSAYTRYWIKVRAYDEALNFSTSNVISCYTGEDFVNTPDFNNSLNVSTSATLAVSFKVLLSTATEGSDFLLTVVRNNLGEAISELVSVDNFQLFTSSVSFKPSLKNNYEYELKITTSLKDIDNIRIGNNENNEIYSFLTVANPSVKNVFFDSSGSSITILSGQTDSLYWVEFSTSEIPPKTGYPVKKEPLELNIYDLQENVLSLSAQIPVIPDGIPYFYSNGSWQKAETKIIDGEIVFEITSPGIYYFVDFSSFVESKPSKIYAYPVPSDGSKITFANLPESPKIEIYTISGKRVFEEKVFPDLVRSEWVWQPGKIAPGLYFWIVDGKEKGMLLIKKGGN